MYYLKKNCLLKVVLEGTVNVKRGRGPRRRMMLDDIKVDGNCVGTKSWKVTEECGDLFIMMIRKIQKSSETALFI